MPDSLPPTPIASTPPGASDVPFTRVYQSAASAFAEPVESVVRSSMDWRRAWISAHPNRAATLPDAPDVDFANDLVLLVSAGTQPTGGISVRIDTVRARADGGADVVYTVTRPGPGCMSIQQVTAPVDVVRIARRAGAIRFVRRTATSGC